MIICNRPTFDVAKSFFNFNFLKHRVTMQSVVIHRKGTVIRFATVSDKQAYKTFFYFREIRSDTLNIVLK